MSALRAKRGKKNTGVQKLRLVQKRAEKSDGPQPDGLWVNKDFFRSLTQRPPQLLFNASTEPEEEYYLKLADTAIGTGERRKTDRVAVAFSKIPEESKGQK